MQLYSWELKQGLKMPPSWQKWPLPPPLTATPTEALNSLTLAGVWAQPLPGLPSASAEKNAPAMGETLGATPGRNRVLIGYLV